jgi:hypothetical protein
MLRNFPTRLHPSKEDLAVIKQRSQEQMNVNRLYYSENWEEAEAELRRLAQVTATEHERYDGPEWVLGVASTIVESRSQAQAKTGDILLLSEDIAGVVSFYSPRLGHRCVAGAGIRPLVGWDAAFQFWRSLTGKKPALLVVEPPGDEEPLSSGEPWLPPDEDKEEP